ncbi:MAG: pilus assembly PilX N-terminal domain-containing protein [Amphritea sp.]|nr:pilus assembly PilX N-terminal domain-containing protein [Amphritea sp.]
MMINGKYRQMYWKRQQGVVLVVTLLAIVAVTVLVTATLLTSTAEEKMAFNAQVTNQTFQAADSALNEVIETDDAMYEAIDAGVGGSSDVRRFDLGINRLNSESVMTYQGKGIPVGTSLSSAITYKFEVSGRGYVDDNDSYGDSDDEAATELLQGVYRISYVTED